MGTHQPERPYVQPGALVDGKYRVEQVLGEGGMGVVVRAHHTVFDEPVALKFLRHEFVEQPNAAARFFREAKAARRIKNEHVAQVLDVGQLPTGEPFMVMEYLEGADMAARLRQHGPLPIAEAVDVVVQACAALAAAHAQGIVHRDVKPANLFLTHDRADRLVIKMLDFGISKLVGSVDALTRTSTTMGSALYMSPEQLKSSRNVDARTDVWSLGVTLYELLSDRVPFIAETMPEVVAAILTEEPVRIDVRRPDVPPELADIVHRALERDRDKRFQTVEALATALAPFTTADGRDAARRLRAIPSSSSLPHVPSVAAPEVETATSFAETLPSNPGLLRDSGTAAIAPARSIGVETAAPMSSTKPSYAPPKRAPVAAVIAIVGALAAATLVALSLGTERAAALRATAFDVPVVSVAAPIATSAASASASAAASASAPIVEAPPPRPHVVRPAPSKDIFKGWK